MNKALRDDFARNFPIVNEEVIEMKEAGQFELIIKRTDGSSWSYYSLTKTLRRLPSYVTAMTEQEVRNEFSLRLNRLMRLKGITQIELSERTGLSRYSIIKYLNGKVTPSFYAVDRIAKALGCSIEEFRYT